MRFSFSLLQWGAVLRVGQFFTTGSFFYDEGCVALSLVTRHSWQLLKPLAYNQAAAPGFLLLEKCLIHFFGTNEAVFRLPALLGSLAVLGMLGILCEKLFNRWVAVVAVAILAVLPLAVFSASELKPYSTDAALTLWMAICFHSLLANPRTKKQWRLFLFSGVIALLLSQTIIFALLSFGLLVVIVEFRKGQSAAKASLVVAVWLCTFLLLYLAIYRFEGNTFYMQTWWAWNMLSIHKPQLAARSFEALRNLSFRSVDALQFLHEKGLILISGVGLYFVVKRVDPIWATALILPYAALILASLLGLFPIAPRLLLFAIPLLVVLIAAGIESLLAKGLRPPFYELCCGLIVCLVIGNGVTLVFKRHQAHFPRLSKSFILRSRSVPNCAAIYVFEDTIPVWEFYTRDVGTGGMPSEETYRKIFDRDSERVFAENPKSPLPEGLAVYRLGCQPMILGALRPRGSRVAVTREAWAHSELMRIKGSGASSAYVVAEAYSPEDLQALLEEAGGMGARVQTLGGGQPFVGYLGEIDFASSVAHN